MLSDNPRRRKKGRSRRGRNPYLGATAIVTGGASGIGRALAEELAIRGCRVTLIDLQIELAEAVAAGIRQEGGQAEAILVDVTDFVAMEQVLRRTYERTGRLDYVFSNAGIAMMGGVHLSRIEDWNRIIDVNLRGVVNGVQAAYQIMLAQGAGHIISTASMAGVLPTPGAVAYATTKLAVVGLSRSLRIEAAQYGIRVSVICPGAVDTPLLDGAGKYGKVLIDVPPAKLRELAATFRPMQPAVLARKALDQVAHNKAMIVVPSWWKVPWWIDRLSQELGLHLAQKSFEARRRILGIELDRQFRNRLGTSGREPPIRALGFRSGSEAAVAAGKAARPLLSKNQTVVRIALASATGHVWKSLVETDAPASADATPRTLLVNIKPLKYKYDAGEVPPWPRSSSSAPVTVSGLKR